jgi:Flp pilus assembly protein TadD
LSGANTEQTVKRAIAFLGAGRRREALETLQSLGAAAAHDPRALQLLGMLFDAPDQRADALALTERAARIAPGDAQAHFNLGVTLQGFDRNGDAIAHYQQALALEPGHLGALNNLSDLYRRRGRAEEGWTLMERFQALGGASTGLEIRLAKLALDTRRLDEAETWFNAAARHAPGDPTVAFEHAMLTLAREDFARGWPQYESRVAVHGLSSLGAYPHTEPPWRGEDVADRAVLLHREQGLGDMLMFSSAVPGLIDEGARVHLAMHPGLVRLFQESFPAAKVWSSLTVVGAAAQPEQPYLRVSGPIDVQAPMCSLGVLRMMDGPPAPRAYLNAPPAEIARWAERLQALAPSRQGERRIGLVIGARRPLFSDDGMTNHRRKSVPPELIEALASATDARWFALHDRESRWMLADVPRLPVVDLSPWITDLADTAAAIANLDLVVTVDTAVAHLAGALGKPVWLLLWRNADWRWGVNRTDSYWYPDVRVFRQRTAGDWSVLLNEVASALG